MDVDRRGSPDLFADEDQEEKRRFTIQENSRVIDSGPLCHIQEKFECLGKVQDPSKLLLEFSTFIQDEIFDVTTACLTLNVSCSSFPTLSRFYFEFDRISLEHEQDVESLFSLLRMAIYDLESVCGVAEQRVLVMSESRNKEAEEIRKEISIVLVYLTQAIAGLCKETSSSCKEAVRNVAFELKHVLLQVSRIHSAPMYGSASGKSGLPYFHTCLEVWYTIFKCFIIIQRMWLDNSPNVRVAEYLQGDVDVSRCSIVEQMTDLLISDLISLAALFFNDELLPGDDSWCFPCSCTLKLWAMVKRLWDTVARDFSGVEFWARLHAAFRRFFNNEGQQNTHETKNTDRFLIPCELRRCFDKSAFFWRLLRCLSYVYRSPGDCRSADLGSIVEYLASVTIVPLLGNRLSRETNDYSHSMHLETKLRPLLSQYLNACHAFDTEPAPDVPFELWAYFQKRLGFTFCTQEIGEMLLVYESASEWLEKLGRLVKQKTDGAADRRNTFELFLAILVTQCTKGDAGMSLWTQMKGRILSKLTSERFKEFSECALFNCMRLLLVSAQFMELEIISEYVLDYFCDIPLFGANGGVSKQKIVWQSLAASILLHQRQQSSMEGSAGVCQFLASSLVAVYQAYVRKKNDVIVRRDLWELLSYSFKLLRELSREARTNADIGDIGQLWTMDFYQIFSDAKDCGDIRGQQRVDFLSAAVELLKRLVEISDGDWRGMESSERSRWCTVVKEKLVRSVRFHLHHWAWSEELAEVWFYFIRASTIRKEFGLVPLTLFNEFVNVLTPNYDGNILCSFLAKLLESSGVLQHISGSQDPTSSDAECCWPIIQAWLRCVFVSPHASTTSAHYVTKRVSRFPQWAELLDEYWRSTCVEPGHRISNHCQLFKEMCLAVQYALANDASQRPKLVALCEKTFKTPIQRLGKLMTTTEPAQVYFHCTRMMTFLVEHCGSLVHQRGTNESLVLEIIAGTVCNVAAETTPELVKKHRLEMSAECLLPILRGLFKCEWIRDISIVKQIQDCYHMEIYRLAHARKNVIMDSSPLVVVFKDTFSSDFNPALNQLGELRRLLLKDLRSWLVTRHQKDRAVGRVALAYLGCLVERTRSAELLANEAEDIAWISVSLWLLHIDDRALVSDCAELIDLCQKKVQVWHTLDGLLCTGLTRVLLEYWQTVGWSKVLSLAARVIKRFPNCKRELEVCVEKVTNDIKNSAGIGDMRLTAALHYFAAEIAPI